MLRHALLLVYLVSGGALSDAHYYGPAAYHPAVYYFPPPQQPFFRSPFYNPFPYVPTPTYFAPPSAYPGYNHRVVTPGSDAVVNTKQSVLPHTARQSLEDDSTVVVAAADAAPVAPLRQIKPSRLIDREVIAPGLVYQSKSTPDVISHGVHLGNVAPAADENPAEGYAQDEGWGQDAPTSTFTQGPQPGSYTAVSSDEESEGTLFESHDGNGNILFGHSSPQQARLESRSLDGSVRGSYSYVDPEGRTVKVRYAAGRDGFQVFDEEGASSVLPRAVEDTAEVLAAKALHARLYQQAKWLAERPETEATGSVVNDNVPEQSTDEVYDVDDKFHPPDSLYAVSEGVKGVEDDLEYYGAAKGQHMVYAARFNAYAHAPLNEQQHLRRSALAHDQPRLSPLSAPSLREQQHLHRSAKSLKVRNQVPAESFFPSSQQQTVPVVVGAPPAPVHKEDDIASTRSAAAPLPESPVQHAVPPPSISQKATFFGAVPVAAVHDAQVSPSQKVSDHQNKPIYIEAN